MFIGKKIAAIAMAAIMTTTMAISASADEYESGTFMGYPFVAKLAAFPSDHMQEAYTSYDSLTAEVYVGLAVADAITGITIDEVPRTGRDGTKTEARARLFVKESPISLFSSHEIIPHSGDDPWAKYFHQSYIIQPEEI